MADNQAELKTPCLLEKPKPAESAHLVTRRILRSSHKANRTRRNNRQNAELKMLKELRLLNVVKAGGSEEDKNYFGQMQRNASSIPGRGNTLPDIKSSEIFVHARSMELHSAEKSGESIEDGKTNIVIKVPELIMDDEEGDDDGGFQRSTSRTDASNKKRTVPTCDAVQVVGGHVSNLSSEEDATRNTVTSSQFVARIKKQSHFPTLPIRTSQPEGIFVRGNGESNSQGGGLRTPRYLVSPNKQTTPYDTFLGVKTLSSRWLNELSEISPSTKSESEDSKARIVRLAVPRTANPIARALRLESSRNGVAGDADFSDSSGSTTISPKCKSARRSQEVESRNSYGRGIESNRGTASATLFKRRQGSAAWPCNTASEDDESGNASVSEISLESEWPNFENAVEKVVVPVSSDMPHQMYKNIGLPYKHSFTAPVKKESSKTVTRSSPDHGKCVTFEEEPKIYNIEFPRSVDDHRELLIDIRGDKLPALNNGNSQISNKQEKVILQDKQKIGDGKNSEIEKSVASKPNISDDPVKRRVCSTEEMDVNAQGASSYSVLDKRYTNHARQKRSRTLTASSPSNVMFKQKDYIGFQHKKFIRKNNIPMNTGTSAFPSGYIDTNKKIPYLKVKIREDE
ncbi:uncharacterized protein LOC106165998 [Lingula anatina]|uniref:Uncharacterized protein LOC106165998 n=1 Tax=Lingula anatina TaxID=7574 RepID=A0A1S3IPL1_LINAN|nr:uncharacterized protein LOC106165998 [Lingula anatina]XP_013399848.1 uncharacterized protein LOC106165998 [Lingula anatina]XP_013399849.1 uncharacterized protein LOC106165998 [Lingula anatina]|eukprot:XP_013399846.1 uncharacterized protein LOC106165998 [Lingula anatina]